MAAPVSNSGKDQRSRSQRNRRHSGQWSRYVEPAQQAAHAGVGGTGEWMLRNPARVVEAPP
jgi:hypothetical protein